MRQLEEDESGAVWVNKAPNQGLQRLRLSPDLKRITASQTFADPGFQHATVNLCRVGSQVLATLAKGIRQFDVVANRFMPVQATHLQLAGNTVRKLFPISDKELLLLRHDGTLSYSQRGQTGSIREVPVRTNQWVDEYEAIVPLDTNQVALCRENGFALLPRAQLPRLLATNVPAPVIRSIAVSGDPSAGRTMQGQALPVGADLSFSHRQNDLVVTFCTPYFTRPVTYSYWLENSTESWSPYSAVQQKEFSNLPPGRYVLHLRSNLSKTERTLALTVRPPWYWTAWSKLLYALLAAGFVWLLYRLHLRRVAMKQDQVRAKLEEKLRHQEEASQREIILLQKEQLEQGLIQKSGELAHSTMSLIQKNELLVELKNELTRVMKRTDAHVSSDHFHRINYLIDNNISSDKDWQLFEVNFTKVHERFLKYLTDNYPDLSQGDLKLAAYLRMNLSTKEIAQLLNITPRSVELKRYRLRKKLCLEAEVNLSEFMIKY